MRSEIADFAPVQPGGVLDQAVFSGVHLVPPPGELDETRASLLFLAHSLHYAKPWRHLQNRKYITYWIAASEGPLSYGHR